MNPEIQNIVSELRENLRELYGERLAHIILFGSQSRGDAISGSDIDILIVLHGHVSPGKEIARTGAIASELSLRYDVVISCTFISIERYQSEKSPLLMNIQREGVPV